jgi:hypothetical protein
MEDDDDEVRDAVNYIMHVGAYKIKRKGRKRTTHVPKQKPRDDMGTK